MQEPKVTRRCVLCGVVATVERGEIDYCDVHDPGFERDITDYRCSYCGVTPDMYRTHAASCPLSGTGDVL